MERQPAPAGHLFCLPPGTRVANWLLLGCHGHGGFGVVYRAVRVGHESEGPVALKMALFPWEPRSMREVGMLSLLQHPSIPRLLGHGFWEHSSGMFFPFVVMEWIEGMSLYEWAREHHPNNAQLFQVLAQLARALEVTHARRAVHRDVKGDNILVRRSDGRAVLTDFGAGHYQSAARLTWQSLPPGTPPYRSPEAWLFAVRSRNSPDASPAPPRPWEQFKARRAGSARVLAAGVLVLWALQAVHAPLPSALDGEQVASNAASQDGGAASLGEAGAETPVPPVQEPSKTEAVSQDTPPKLFPGQVTPDAKGQCPGRKQAPINGGCWLEQSTKDAGECEENGMFFIKGRCYAPVMGHRRKPPPTSAPPDYR